MSYLTIRSTDPVVECTKALLEHIFPSPRNYTILLWNQDELHAEGILHLPWH